MANNIFVTFHFDGMQPKLYIGFAVNTVYSEKKHYVKNGKEYKKCLSGRKALKFI